MEGRDLNLEIEEIGADLIKNTDYCIDLEERRIEKRDRIILLTVYGHCWLC
jgi:hypothetical protein